MPASQSRGPGAERDLVRKPAPALRDHALNPWIFRFTAAPVPCQAACAEGSCHGHCPLRKRIRRFSMRLGALFVAVCMTIIAGSAGAVVYSFFGVSIWEAAIVAVATLTALAIYNTVSSRVGTGSTLERQVT